MTVFCERRTPCSIPSHGLRNEISANRLWSVKRLHKQSWLHRLLTVMWQKFRFGAETIDATKSSPEPPRLRGTSRCATRGTMEVMNVTGLEVCCGYLLIIDCLGVRVCSFPS